MDMRSRIRAGYIKIISFSWFVNKIGIKVDKDENRVNCFENNEPESEK